MSWAALCAAEVCTKPAPYRSTIPNRKADASCSGFETVVEIVAEDMVAAVEVWFFIVISPLVEQKLCHTFEGTSAPQAERM